MSFIGATGLDENQEQFDILKDEIDANASYINNLVGIPDPLHTAVFGINVLNPGLFGLVERAEVKIKLLETAEEGLGTDVTGLTTQVEGIQTEVTGIQTEITGIQTEITGIQTEITGIQTEITGIEGTITAIQFVELPLLAATAVDAKDNANRALSIWDYSGDNVYHKKTGNVGIGTTFGSVLSNRLEVNGNINIPTGSTFRINNEPFNYSHLAGEQPVSSKWTNATDTTTNIYYNTGNVGIGVTTAINAKLEVAGNLNISAGSKYKINNVNLGFSDLGGTLSYNSLSDKPTLFDGNYNSLTNKLTGGTNIQILNGVINNTYTYTLPTAGVGTGGALGGVRVDNSTIFINNGVISSAGGTPQVNSDWTQTNTNLKSFIQNKPTAGTNISFANNTITNIITGSPTQNIITLNDNYLIVKDKPDSQIVSEVDVPLTSGNEPTINPSVIVADAYYPRVPATNSATWTDSGYSVSVKVSDAVLNNQFVYFLFNHIITSQDHYHSQQSYTGTGNTYAGATRFKTFAGISISVDFGRSIYPERMRIAPRPLQAGFSGNDFINGAPKAFKIFASDNVSCWNDNNHSSWTQIHDQTTGLTYTNEQYTIVNFTTNLPKYRYYTMVVLSTIGNYAGGYLIFSEWNIGGDENIDAIPEGNPITHKTLNFAYDLTKYTEYQAQLKTGVGGWRIVRFLPPNLGRWYQGDYINTSTFTIPTIGTPYSYTNEWAISFGTFDEMFFGTFDMTYWLQCLKTSVLGSYGGVTRPIIKSSSSSTPYSAIWYNRGQNPEDPWISIADHPSLVVYGENSIAVNMSLLNAYGGMCVLVRDSTASTTIPNPNTYTLSVQPGTSIQVNNQPAQYLSGNYTISVGATQSSVLGQSGQTNPYPLQNGSTIAIRYSMLQRITSTINIKKDGLIKYIPSSGTNPTTGSWNIIDIDNQPLTQFSGNLPISRIDGNVSGKLPLSLTDGNLPAIRLDNIDMSKVSTGNLAWSRISSQPALSSLSGNLDWSRIDSKPALSSLSGSLLWNRIDQGSFYMPVDRWIQDTNAYDRFYLAGNSTTFIRGFSATIVEFRDGNNNTRSIFNSSGQLACHFQTVSPTNTDHLGVGANTGDGGFGYYYIHVLYNTFTGYHRCYYEDDDIFNNDMSNEEIDIFKNNYKGRIVISTGKIKTDISRTIPNEETEDDGNRPSNYEEIKNESPNVEWYSTIDKDGIMIEDAIPIVQLSKVRKDKRVYGVLGSADRKTNNKNRLIVNSVGEGAICVCNSNGNIENGDYICSSELLGFGEKQDDDLLHNYSVAKAVMDCTFELDSPYYQCYQLESGVRVAFIACTYHSG